MADSSPLPENSSAAAVVSVANSQQPPLESDDKTSQSDPAPAAAAAPPVPPPSIQPYSTVPPPSFRPAAPPAPVPGGATPLFSPLPPQQQQQSLSFANPAVQPPGVSSVAPAMNPMHAGGSVPQIMQPPYGVPGQLMRPYAPMPNGYTAIPQPGAMPHHVS